MKLKYAFYRDEDDAPVVFLTIMPDDESQSLKVLADAQGITNLRNHLNTLLETMATKNRSVR